MPVIKIVINTMTNSNVRALIINFIWAWSTNASQTEKCTRTSFFISTTTNNFSFFTNFLEKVCDWPSFPAARSEKARRFAWISVASDIGKTLLLHIGVTALSALWICTRSFRVWCRSLVLLFEMALCFDLQLSRFGPCRVSITDTVIQINKLINCLWNHIRLNR